MIVGSDTSPVTNLIGCQLLHLLPALYGRVLVPQAVCRELAVLADVDPAYDVAAYGWVEVRTVHDQQRVAGLLCRHLDRGEAEALVLAAKVNAHLVLIDERRGSEVADELDLPHVGVLGTLLAAKKRGLIAAVAPVVDELRYHVGFWLTDDVVQRVTELAGER